MDTYVDKVFYSKDGDNLFLQDLFYIKLKEAPDAIAVIFGERKITYTELNAQSENLSQVILSDSPKSSIIGISTNRSIEMIVGVLAILKSGKAYLPLDPDYPQDRLQQIITDSGVDLCLTTSAQKHLFEPLSINVLVSDAVYEAGNEAIPASKSACYVLY